MKKNLKPALLALLFALPLLAASCNSQEQNSGYQNATLEQAHKAWQENQQRPGTALFLDVRTEGEYAQGHVPGAKLLPVQQLANRISEVPRDIPVYVYCVAGVRSSRSSNMLLDAGFTNIINIPDGFPGWRAKGYPAQ
ncbi:MAG: rhodanese-like domain-containing protein [Mariprofundaceae bacterium]